MMTKENQLVSFQDQLLLVEKKVEKITSSLHQLEKSLKQLKIQFVKGERKDEKYYLLKSELERVEKSARICGHLYRMLFAVTNFPVLNPFDLEDAFSLVDVEELDTDTPILPFNEEIL